MAFLQTSQFLGFFSRVIGHFRSTWGHIGKKKNGSLKWTVISSLCSCSIPTVSLSSSSIAPNPLQMYPGDVVMGPGENDGSARRTFWGVFSFKGALAVPFSVLS